MAKELSLINQTKKTIREHYQMSHYEFNSNVKSILAELNKLSPLKSWKRCKNVSPAQVRKIIKKLDGIDR